MKYQVCHPDCKSLENITDAYVKAVSTGPDHLVFGYGSQACPGRFFAIHEAKVALARVLVNYDFKLKDKPVDSPMARVVGVLTTADPSVKFLFKSRN